MPSLLLLIAASLGAVFLRWRWRRYPRGAMVATVCALGLNYAWEIGQLPLFAGFTNVNISAALLHCAWYTLGDATIVVCLYALGAWGHRTWGWGRRLQGLDWLWLPLTGMLVAMVIERLALDVGRWQYGPHMPVLPGLEVSLLSVVQMSLLPLLSVVLARRFIPCPGHV